MNNKIKKQLGCPLNVILEALDKDKIEYNGKLLCRLYLTKIGNDWMLVGMDLDTEKDFYVKTKDYKITWILA